MNRSADYGHLKTPHPQRRENAGKTADAIYREIAREVNQLLRVIFHSRRKTGIVDLEALKMAVRPDVHRAGAAALNELLQFRRLPPMCEASHCHSGQFPIDRELDV